MPDRTWVMEKWARILIVGREDAPRKGNWWELLAVLFQKLKKKKMKSQNKVKSLRNLGHGSWFPNLKFSCYHMFVEMTFYFALSLNPYVCEPLHGSLEHLFIPGLRKYTLNHYNFIDFNYTYMRVCLHVCVHHMCTAPVEARRGHCTPQNWSYRRLGAAMWKLEAESEFSARSASCFNCWTISPAPAVTSQLVFYLSLFVLCFFLILNIVDIFTLTKWF